MTVTANDTVEREIVNGTGPYAFSFRIFDEGDLTVVAIEPVTGAPASLSINTHYTVTGTGATGGGTITLTSGAATTYDGYTIDIRSNVSVAQPAALGAQSSLRLSALETALDRVTRQIQDMQRVVRLCLKVPDNENFPTTTFPRAEDREGTFWTFDAGGNLETGTPIDEPLTNSLIATTLDSLKRTAAEIAAGVTPSNYAYPPGNVLRYGADSTGVADSSDAFQKATDTGQCVTIPEGTFKVSGITYTGAVDWKGEGELSIIRSDSDVLTVTTGTDSRIDNIYFENITAPWIITRDPADWGADISGTLAQSNDDGYQPTVNDADIWGTLTAGQQNQQIGPRVLFQGAASNIKVSRLYGRFFRVELLGATRSVVRDCNFRGGKGFAGGIVFWNEGGSAGMFNRALNNHVRFASFSGVAYANNTDGMASNNVVELCGESGVKTFQGAGYSCFNMTISDNKVNRNYYDGLDTASNQPLDDAILTSHLVVGNESYGNGGDGINADGQRNAYVSNKFWNNGRYGFWGLCSNSLIADNLLYNNNTEENASWHEMLTGEVGNYISGNRIFVENGGISKAIHAHGSHVVTGNYASGAAFDFGTFAGTYANNVDSVSGLLTDQSFVLLIRNNAGTIEHAFYAQAAAAAMGNFQSRINGANSTFGPTPTGADASTAMAGGGKIGSASTHVFWLDTAAQVPANSYMCAAVVLNTTDTALTVRAQIGSIDINGVTRMRLVFEYLNAATGAAFALTTANIDAGEEIQVQFIGKLN